MKYGLNTQKTIPMLDAGHGGMLNGVYATAPNFKPKDKRTWKKSHWFKKTGPILEGVINRQIRKDTMALLDEVGFAYLIVNTGEADMPLRDRVERCNQLWVEYLKRPYLMSIHCNGGGGTGIEVYTSPGQTRSDVYAAEWAKAVKEVFPKEVFRADYSDGDPDKEAPFYVLKNTHCPAFLTETFFMDRMADAEKLLDPRVIRKIAEANVKAILAIEAL